MRILREVGDMMRECTVPGCNKKLLAKGYCNNHYAIFRRHGCIPDRTIHTPNDIVNKGTYSEVCIYNGKLQEVARALVDNKDIPEISKFKWHLDAHGYVRTSRKQYGIVVEYHKMHQMVLSHKGIDHKNGVKVDNRRDNLRKSTNQQNQCNKGKQKNNTSGYKGVHLFKPTNKWAAAIKVHSKSISLGHYSNKIDAARAYNRAALTYHGEFARLNTF